MESCNIEYLKIVHRKDKTTITILLKKKKKWRILKKNKPSVAKLKFEIAAPIIIIELPSCIFKFNNLKLNL